MAEKQKQDRISEFLVERNKQVMFDELSEKYLKDSGMYDILNGVPVPLSFDEEGMSTLTIAIGMAKIVGGDGNFKYANRYLEYIKRILGDVAVRVLVSEAARAGSIKDYETACMLCRTALMLDPKSCDALYLYGRACKDAYEVEEKSEDYVGSFKAESLECFELLTIMHPDFAMGYYFLGYGYLNLGLYIKAQLTWKTFMELTDDIDVSSEENLDKPEDRSVDYDKLRIEIRERLEALEEPVKIEEAINHILSGDFQRGREILNEYKTGRYAVWWPLWYYLGIANASLGDADEAISNYKTALKYSPSNIEVMEELCNIYKAIGDEEGLQKYSKKIEIVKANIENESLETNL